MVGGKASVRPCKRLRPQIAALLAGGLVSVLLGGCIYLRLLELRNQLADFDRFFESDLRAGVRITCKKPVLLDADMAFFKLVPESRDGVGAAERWHFRWVKAYRLPGEDPRNYEVAVDFIFVDHKLTRVILPERLFTFVPKQFFLTLVRSFGHAFVDAEKRTATTSVHEDFGPGNIPPQLTQAELAAVLGGPMEAAVTPAGLAWHYRYQAVSGDLASNRIDVTFTLNPVTQKMRRIEGRVFNLTLDITFPDSTTPAPGAINPPAHDARP
jgi:hypothetical protein